MNAQRRKALTEIITRLEVARDDLDVLISEEQDYFDNMTPTQRESLARFVMGELAHTNPNFNRARFLEACGVGDPTKR